MNKNKKKNNLVQKQKGFLPYLPTDNEDAIKIVAGGDVQFDSVVIGDPVVSDLKSTSRYQRILRRILEIIGCKCDIT